MTDDARETAPTPSQVYARGASEGQWQNDPAQHPALAYATVMARTLDMSLLNLGVGGHVFDVEGLCAPPHPAPDLITVAYGINDWNRSCDIASARPWLGRLREWYPEAPVFVFEPIWAGKEGMDVSPKPNSAGRTLADARRELGGIVDGEVGHVRSTVFA